MNAEDVTDDDMMMMMNDKGEEQLIEEKQNISTQLTEIHAFMDKTHIRYPMKTKTCYV